MYYGQVEHSQSEGGPKPYRALGNFELIIIIGAGGVVALRCPLEREKAQTFG